VRERDKSTDHEHSSGHTGAGRAALVLALTYLVDDEEVRVVGLHLRSPRLVYGVLVVQRVDHQHRRVHMHWQPAAAAAVLTRSGGVTARSTAPHTRVAIADSCDLLHQRGRKSRP